MKYMSISLVGDALLNKISYLGLAQIGVVGAKHRSVFCLVVDLLNKINYLEPGKGERKEATGTKYYSYFIWLPFYRMESPIWG